MLLTHVSFRTNSKFTKTQKTDLHDQRLQCPFYRPGLDLQVLGVPFQGQVPSGPHSEGWRTALEGELCTCWWSLFVHRDDVDEEAWSQVYVQVLERTEAVTHLRAVPWPHKRQNPCKGPYRIIGQKDRRLELDLNPRKNQTSWNVNLTEGNLIEYWRQKSPDNLFLPVWDLQYPFHLKDQCWEPEVVHNTHVITFDFRHWLKLSKNNSDCFICFVLDC